MAVASKTFLKNKLDSKFEISKHGLSNLLTRKQTNKQKFSKQIYQLGLCLHNNGHNFISKHIKNSFTSLLLCVAHKVIIAQQSWHFETYTG